jgi:AraC-like DNA-binding protein
VNTLLLLGIFQSLFLLLLLINKKSKSQADFVLMSLLVYTGVHLSFFYVNFNDDLVLPDWIMIIGGSLPLLYGPILYWYVQALIQPKPLRIFSFLLHGAPFVLLAITFLFFHYQVNDCEVLVFDGFIHLKGPFPTIIYYFSILFAVSGGLYPTICLFLLIRHKKNIHNQFSYEDEITLDWLRTLIIFTLAGFLVSFFSILFIVDYGLFEDSRMAFYIVSGSSALFVFAMGYFGLKQTLIFSSRESIPPKSGRYDRSGLEAERSKSIMKKLDSLMLAKEPWKNPKLTLQTLAETLDVSSNHLSQAINENKELNFFEYVNSYRVEEFKRKLQNPQNNHLTHLGIAYDCGFNSKSTFNHIFKSRTGITPSAYKKTLIQAN